MQRVGQFIAWAVIIGGVIATVALIYTLMSSFSEASDTIKVATIGAIVSIFTFVVSRYFEQKRARSEYISNERIRVYRKFLDMFFRVFANKDVSRALKHENTDEESKNDWLLAEIAEFQKEIIFWASDETIKKWGVFRDISTSRSVLSPDKDSVDTRTETLVLTLNTVCELIIQMRRDIGYSFTAIKPKDIAKMLLKSDDPEVQIVLKML